MKSVKKMSQVCSQIVLKCCYLARIGRPDVLWSVNKLTRSITKWTKACDKRLNRVISYVHHICEKRRDPWVDNRQHSSKKWTLISEYQNYHMRLWKKQKISASKSSSRRSKVEKYFKQICSRIRSTTDSTKIRIRWAVKWEMWSFSSCAKLYQKYNVFVHHPFGPDIFWSSTLPHSSPKCPSNWVPNSGIQGGSCTGRYVEHYENMFYCILYWNQEIIYCTKGQISVESESKKRVFSSRTTWSRKSVAMILDTTKLKNRKSTI